jgi:lipoprotein NlpI
VTVILAFALTSCADKQEKQASIPYEVTLAAAAMQGQDYDEAANLWTNALALQSLTTEQRARALWGRSASYWKAGKRSAAMDDANAAIALKADMPELFQLRGDLYLAARDYGHANDDFDTAIRLKADSPDAHAARAEARFEQGQFDLAIADLDLAIGFKSYVDGFYVARAKAYLAEGKTDKAAADFNEAIRRDPTNVNAHDGRGLLEYSLGRLPEAVADLQQSLSAKPGQAYPVIWLRLTRMRMKARDESEFAQAATSVDLAKWPGPVVSFYRGTLSADGLQAEAATVEAKDGNSEKCEADYYIGESLLAGRKADEGKRLLVIARQTCPTNFFEHRLAEIALER